MNNTPCTLQPHRHINLTKYYPHINLLIQLTILLTFIILLAHFQTNPTELHNMGIT